MYDVAPRRLSYVYEQSSRVLARVYKHRRIRTNAPIAVALSDVGATVVRGVLYLMQ